MSIIVFHQFCHNRSRNFEPDNMKIVNSGTEYLKNSVCRDYNEFLMQNPKLQEVFKAAKIGDKFSAQDFV